MRVAALEEHFAVPALAARIGKEVIFAHGLTPGIAQHPGRCAGFTHLPTVAPEAAVDELERCTAGHGICGSPAWQHK